MRSLQEEIQDTGVTAREPDSGITDYMLEISGLRIAVESNGGMFFAVNGLNLQVRKGEIHGLTGLSGVGKTMTALAVLGLVQVRPGVVGGSIKYMGSDLLSGLGEICRIGSGADGRVSVNKDYTDWERIIDKRFEDLRGSEMSLIPQEPRSSLDPLFSVGQQLEEVIHFGLMGSQDHKGLLADALANVGFDKPAEILHKYPHEMSGGECQRVAIALAASAGARLIIADEPTSSVDAPTRRGILEMLRRLVSESDKTIILITHDLDLISEYCDSYTVMLGGKDVEYGMKQGNGHTIPMRHPYTVVLRRMSEAVLDGGAGYDDLLVSRAAGSESGGSCCAFYSLCSVARQRTDLAERCRNSEPPLHSLRGERYVRCWALSIDKEL
jgi:ABC-type dipeptide/oligopeptide/nickel transport system ATPase component